MNPLFNMTGAQPANNMLANVQKLGQLMSILKSGNPNAIAAQMLLSNPQFRQFVEQNRGKAPEQIAQEHGIDWNSIRNALGGML